MEVKKYENDLHCIQVYVSGRTACPEQPRSTLGNTKGRLYSFTSFPGDSNGKEPACQHRWCKRFRFNSWAGKIPGGGHSNPLQYSRILARILRTEAPGRLQSITSHRVRHNWSDSMYACKAGYVLSLTQCSSSEISPVRSEEALSLECVWT